jgi:hypothetical protein
MSKVTIEYNLDDDSYDRLDLEYALKAKDAFLVLFDFEQYLRNQMKHVEMSDEAYEAFETIQNKFYKIRKEYVGDLEIY